jgi:cytidine deaminase
MNAEEVRRLLEEAARYRLRARCAYSGFAVGAAIEAAGGRVYGGCNVENASYGLTVCAERVALWKALSEGDSEFRAVAVVTGASEPTRPCGACRQLLWEYCGDIEVLMQAATGKIARCRLSELFPEPFEYSR